MAQKLAIAVDLGATNVRVALVSQEGKILKKIRETTTKQGRNGIVITNQIIRMIQEICRDIHQKRLAGISISSIGPLDYEKGGPVRSPSIPFGFVPLVKPLEKTCSLPVHLLNDAKAAALGEKYFGAGKNVKNLVYITISTGIGGGAIVDGHLLLGKGGNAAEIGHMIIDTTYNFPCGCGKGVGHWEGYASGKNIPQFFQFWLKKTDKKVAIQFQEAKDIFTQARRKNRLALEFLGELSKINARAISNIIVAYDPELITIGGSVALNNPKFILDGINKYVDHCLKPPKTQITKLGDDISLLGVTATIFSTP